MSTESLSKKELLQRLYNLGHTSSSIVVQFHQAAAEKFGLNATDMKTIPLLAQDQPVSAGQLAKTLGLTTGAITSVIDRLEKIGLVRRVADPTDRRKVIAQVVPEGYAKVYEVYQPMSDAMQTLHQRYSKEQLETIIDFVERSNQIMHKEALALRDR